VRLVVATPAMRLATAKARAALADVLPRRDAIFNLQRALAFVHALQHREFGMLREAVPGPVASTGPRRTRAAAQRGAGDSRSGRAGRVSVGSRAVDRAARA
jgi:homoserine kinase